MRPPGGPETNEVTFTGSLCHGCYYICSEQRCVIIPELLPSKIQGGWATRQMLLCKQSTWRQFMTWQKEERKGQDGAPRNDVLGILGFLFAPTLFLQEPYSRFRISYCPHKEIITQVRSRCHTCHNLANDPPVKQGTQGGIGTELHMWCRPALSASAQNLKKYSIQCSLFIP